MQRQKLFLIWRYNLAVQHNLTALEYRQMSPHIIGVGIARVLNSVNTLGRHSAKHHIHMEGTYMQNMSWERKDIPSRWTIHLVEPLFRWSIIGKMPECSLLCLSLINAFIQIHKPTLIRLRKLLVGCFQVWQIYNCHMIPQVHISLAPSLRNYKVPPASIFSFSVMDDHLKQSTIHAITAVCR